MEKNSFMPLYEAPQVEIVEVAVEKGFAATGDYESQTFSGEGKDSGSGWWFE